MSKNRPCDMIVGTTELAEVLGITSRRVQQLGRQGVVPRAGPGKWSLGASIQGYMAYREAITSGGDDTPELKEEQARYYKAKADQEEMKARVMAGNLVPAEQVGAAIRTLILSARAQLAAIPSRVAGRFPDRAHVHGLIESEVRAALESLADREIQRAEDHAVAP